MENSQGLDPAIKILREGCEGEHLEYRMVMAALSQWQSPRAKLTRLLGEGALVRVTKGLYVFGPALRRSPLVLPALANIIRGPSYVSLEWALSYYGLIPEGVAEITSVTCKGSATYETPLGRFSYAHQHANAYSIGVTLKEENSGESFLLATPEKALCDQLVLRRGKMVSTKAVGEVLCEDLRIEEEELARLDMNLLRDIHRAYPHSALLHLINFMEKLVR